VFCEIFNRLIGKRHG